MGFVKFLKDASGRYSLGEEVSGSITTQPILSEKDVEKLIAKQTAHLSREIKNIQASNWKKASRKKK